MKYSMPALSGQHLIYAAELASMDPTNAHPDSDEPVRICEGTIDVTSTRI
jgi:hypothetical protein